MKRDRKAEALRWFRQAEEELTDAAFLKESGKLYLALFLCQQSAEKALKAFIYSHEEEPIFSLILLPFYCGWHRKSIQIFRA